MSQPIALPTFREQDFQAPQSRTVGAGVEGLEEITDLERSERLRRMREGTLGSIHSWELVTAVDGPGTRMTVFLNGCPLRCLYCHNPDTFLAKRILMGAKEMGVHTCIDTSGFLGANCDDEMLDAIDLVLLDVKSGNEETYKKTTGRSLAPTIEFGDRIAARGGATRIWIRFVLVPGLTDDPENVRQVGEIVSRWKDVIDRVEVLPFHQLGKDKWHSLGLEYHLEDTKAPTPEATEEVRNYFRSLGFLVH